MVLVAVLFGLVNADVEVVVIELGWRMVFVGLVNDVGVLDELVVFKVVMGGLVIVSEPKLAVVAFFLYCNCFCFNWIKSSTDIFLFEAICT